jgi:hypothetical protein
VSTSPAGGVAERHGIRPATLRIGRPRPNANGALLQP